MNFKRTLVLLAFLTLSIPQAFAWGQIGHYLIGYMADMQLKNSVRKKVDRVLYPMSIGRTGPWMDEIKSDRSYDYANSWHYMTSEHGEYNAAIQEKGGNIFEEIQRIKTELKSGNLSPENEAIQLRMLIHLIEDIHQPLHVGTGNDRGGNDVKIQYFGRDTNLHALWDSGMIENRGMSYTEIGNELSRRITPELEKKYRNSTMEDWIAEAVALRPMIYDLPENKKLSYGYAYDNYKYAEERMIAASIRLAQVLEEIYG